MKKIFTPKNPLKTATINTGIFNCDIGLIISSHDDMLEYAKQWFDGNDIELSVEPEHNINGKCLYAPGKAPLIWLRNTPKSPKEYATLTHESIHAVFHIFKTMDIPITAESEHLLAYTVDYTVSGLLEKLQK